MTNILKRRNIALKNWKVFVLVAVMLHAGQAAAAAREDKISFHQFKNQNQGLDRQFARHLYRQQFQSPRQTDQRQDKYPGIGHGGITAVPNKLNGFSHQPASIHHNHRLMGQSLQFNDRGNLVKLASGIDLDLSSGDRKIVLGERLFAGAGSVEIQIGDTTKTFAAGAHVTAAEYIAVKQVLGGFGQSVSLNSSGQATGGSVDLSSLTQNNDVMRATNLVVPVNVTTLGDFAKGSDFRLLGNLDNFGTVETFDGGGKGRAGTIHAQNIVNQHHALITSTVDLAMRADQNITNNGTITSAGSLSLEAQQLTNNGRVSADKNVQLNAYSIKNSGIVVSHKGDINIDMLQGIDDLQALTVDNTNGTLSALNGAINVRTPSYSGSQNTFVSGGDLLSSELNLNSGNGTINVGADKVTGTVSSTGSAAHVMAATDELILGEICLTGDPTFFNTAGAIAINGNITVLEALTIVAAGDININNGSDLTAADPIAGFPITLIAGANFTNTGGANQGTIGPVPPVVNNGSVTINGGSASGGSILFNSSAGVGTVISTRPTGLIGDGADVLLVAFDGASATSGRVNVGFALQDSILTGGFGTSDNGNVTVIAPSGNGTSTLPIISMAGGTGFGAHLTVTAADPIANAVTYNASGSLTAGQIVPAVAIQAGGEVQFQSVDAGAGQVLVNANQIQLNNTGNMTARRIDFDASAGIGTIKILGDLTATTLFTATANAPIDTRAGANIGSVTSPFSILTTSSSIGSVSNFDMTGGTVIADSGLGVNILSSGGINIGGGSSNNGNFGVFASGNTTISGTISVNQGGIFVQANGTLSASAANLFTNNGNINLSSGVGTFSASAASISTSNGDITLTNLGTDKKTTKLFLTGSQISAPSGDITVSVSLPDSPIAGKAPKKNIILNALNGGNFFFGLRGITTLAPNSQLTADNADIVFSNPLSKKSIVLTDTQMFAAQ